MMRRVDLNMTREVVILIADDDAGPARFIEKRLSRAAAHNSTPRLENLQQMLDFSFGKCDGANFAGVIKNLGRCRK